MSSKRWVKTLGLEKVREALKGLTGKEAGRRLNLRLIHLEKSDGSNESLKKKPSCEPSPQKYADKQKGKPSLIA